MVRREEIVHDGALDGGKSAIFSSARNGPHIDLEGGVVRFLASSFTCFSSSGYMLQRGPKRENDEDEKPRSTVRRKSLVK